MNELQRIVELSKERCFSLWYDPDGERYYTDTEKSVNSIWICDIDHEISVETIQKMTKLVLQVTEELDRKGYLRKE